MALEKNQLQSIEQYLKELQGLSTAEMRQRVRGQNKSGEKFPTTSTRDCILSLVALRWGWDVAHELEKTTLRDLRRANGR